MKISVGEYHAERSPLYITTCSGRRFYIDKPEFHIADQAASLSKQCRFTGHAKFFYSVAEHELLVMRLMEDLGLGDPREGLTHDNGEAYLSDIASPWKALLPDYKVLEKRIEVPLRLWLGLPEQITDGCKRADWLALMIEANTLLADKGASIIAPDDIKEQAASLVDRYPISGHSWVQARGLYMYWFEKLFPEIKS